MKFVPAVMKNSPLCANVIAMSPRETSILVCFSRRLLSRAGFDNFLTKNEKTPPQSEYASEMTGYFKVVAV